MLIKIMLLIVEGNVKDSFVEDSFKEDSMLDGSVIEDKASKCNVSKFLSTDCLCIQILNKHFKSKTHAMLCSCSPKAYSCYKKSL